MSSLAWTWYVPVAVTVGLLLLGLLTWWVWRRCTKDQNQKSYQDNLAASMRTTNLNATGGRTQPPSLNSTMNSTMSQGRGHHHHHHHHHHHSGAEGEGGRRHHRHHRTGSRRRQEATADQPHVYDNPAFGNTEPVTGYPVQVIVHPDAGVHDPARRLTSDQNPLEQTMTSSLNATLSPMNMTAVSIVSPAGAGAGGGSALERTMSGDRSTAGRSTGHGQETHLLRQHQSSGPVAPPVSVAELPPPKWT